MGAGGWAPLTLTTDLLTREIQGSCAGTRKKFKAFSFNNSRPAQGLLPVDHSVAYNTTGTWEKKRTGLKHSCMTFINNKRFKQFFYPLNSNMAGSSHSHQVLLKVSHRQIPNFSRPSTRFPTFSVLWNLRAFQRWPWIQGWRRNPGDLSILARWCYHTQTGGRRYQSLAQLRSPW